MGCGAEQNLAANIAAVKGARDFRYCASANAPSLTIALLVLGSRSSRSSWRRRDRGELRGQAIACAREDACEKGAGAGTPAFVAVCRARLSPAARQSEPTLAR